MNDLGDRVVTMRHRAVSLQLSCAHLHTLWKPRVNCSCLLQELSHCSWSQGLPLPWNSPSRLGLLAGEPQ